MVGLMQIMIYLLYIYLKYKGVEIFQIAYMSNSPSRSSGLAIGILAIIGAVVVGIGTFVITEAMVASIGNNLQMPR